MKYGSPFALVFSSLAFTLLALASGALGTSAAAPASQGASYGAGPVPGEVPTQSANFTQRILTLDYGVEYQLSVSAGAATRWIAKDNPLFHEGDLVRPISVSGYA